MCREEVDKDGIEPPTLGFSVSLSSALDSLLTSNNLSACDSSGNGEESDAQQKTQHLGVNLTRNDPRLARLIEVWPTLAEDEKRTIRDFQPSRQVVVSVDRRRVAAADRRGGNSMRP